MATTEVADYCRSERAALASRLQDAAVYFINSLPTDNPAERKMKALLLGELAMSAANMMNLLDSAVSQDHERQARTTDEVPR